MARAEDEAGPYVDRYLSCRACGYSFCARERL